jgi:hypothetical protein
MLKSKAIGRRLLEKGESFMPRGSQGAYNIIFTAKNNDLRAENSYRGKINPNI